MPLEERNRLEEKCGEILEKGDFGREDFEDFLQESLYGLHHR